MSVETPEAAVESPVDPADGVASVVENVDPDSVDGGVMGVAVPENELSPYDFRTPPEIGLPRQAEMEEVIAEFASELQPWMGARFREPVTLVPNGIELAPFRHVRDGLVKPATCFLYGVKEAGDRTAVMVFGRDFAFAAVERMLGGKADPVSAPRALTALEQRVVGLVADRFLGDYERNWKDHVSLTFEPQGFESAPELLQVAAREDRYFGVHLEVRGESWASTVSLWLPTEAMDEYMAASPEKVVAPRIDPAIQQDRDKVRSTLLATHVPLRARLPRFRLPLGTVAAFAPGQVIPTRLPVDTPIELWAGGQPRFLAGAGRSGSQLAVRVIGPVETSATDSHSND